MKKILWGLFIFFAVFVGIYPVAYFIFDMRYGFLATKAPELLQSALWNWAFYQHIVFGAVALLVGWSQFCKKFRNRYLATHRLLGKVYLIAIVLSGIAGLYLAFYATAGIIAAAGFTGLAIGWLFTSAMAWLAIRQKNIDQHQHWMIRSYALCFAAVTLRIWLPLMQQAMGIDFSIAYRIVAWLCWVPNLIVAEWIVRRMKMPGVQKMPQTHAKAV
jgi:hypothetical protein